MRTPTATQGQFATNEMTSMQGFNSEEAELLDFVAFRCNCASYLQPLR